MRGYLNSISLLRRSVGYCASACLAMLVSVAPLKAAVVAYEGFDYVPAEDGLSGASGGSGWDNNWSAVNNDIRAAGLGYVSGANQLVAGGGSARLDLQHGGSFRSFTPAYATAAGTYWISFLAQIGNGSSYAGLSLFNENNQEMLFLGDTSGYSTWGMETHGAGSSIFGSGLGVNHQAFIVARIDFNVSGDTDNVRMWINPSLSSTPLDAAASAADLDIAMNNGTALTFDRIRIQQGLSGDNAIFDEIRIGTTWADVSPFEEATSMIPEPGATGLFMLGALLIRNLRTRRGEKDEAGA